jgi:hypothetical protein
VKVLPTDTDWKAMVLRLRRVADHAKGQRFIAANVDLADLERLLKELE